MLTSASNSQDTKIAAKAGEIKMACFIAEHFKKEKNTEDEAIEDESGK